MAERSSFDMACVRVLRPRHARISPSPSPRAAHSVVVAMTAASAAAAASSKDPAPVPHAGAVQGGGYNDSLFDVVGATLASAGCVNETEAEIARLKDERKR